MKIGELAKAVGCSVEAIRFYEKKGLLPPPARSSGNFRVYNSDHLQRLSFICYCRYLDISLDEIKILVNLENQSDEIEQSKEINDLLDRHIREVANHIHKLEHLRMHLVQLKMKCGDLSEENSLMRILQHSSMNFIRFK